MYQYPVYMIQRGMIVCLCRLDATIDTCLYIWCVAALVAPGFVRTLSSKVNPFPFGVIACRENKKRCYVASLCAMLQEKWHVFIRRERGGGGIAAFWRGHTNRLKFYPFGTPLFYWSERFAHGPWVYGPLRAVVSCQLLIS